MASYSYFMHGNDPNFCLHHRRPCRVRSFGSIYMHHPQSSKQAKATSWRQMERIGGLIDRSNAPAAQGPPND